MSVYNVVGPADKVTEMIRNFKRPYEPLIEDEFPTEDAKRDVNVEIPEEREDEFRDWCEDNNLDPRLL